MHRADAGSCARIDGAPDAPRYVVTAADRRQADRHHGHHPAGRGEQLAVDDHRRRGDGCAGSAGGAVTLPPSPSPAPAPGPSPEPAPTPGGDADPPAAGGVAGFDQAGGAPAAPAPGAAEAAWLRYLRPFPVVRVKGRLVARGAKVTLLRVRAPARAKVDVRCAAAGAGCTSASAAAGASGGSSGCCRPGPGSRYASGARRGSASTSACGYARARRPSAATPASCPAAGDPGHARSPEPSGGDHAAHRDASLGERHHHIGDDAALLALGRGWPARVLMRSVIAQGSRPHRTPVPLFRRVSAERPLRSSRIARADRERDHGGRLARALHLPLHPRRRATTSICRRLPRCFCPSRR